VQLPLAVDLLPDDDELHDRRVGADGQRRLADLLAGVAGLLELQRFEPIAEPARRTTGGVCSRERAVALARLSETRQD
jgi:CHAD domain-containing protein